MNCTLPFTTISSFTFCSFPQRHLFSLFTSMLQGYFDAAQMELFDHNIQVTNVCPGPVVSNIVENAAQKDFDQVRKGLKKICLIGVT